MYSFKRVTIDKAVYDHDMSGYIKYIGYAIPVMYGLSYYNEPSAVTIDGIKHICLTYFEIREFFRNDKTGHIYHPNDYYPTSGIWIDVRCKVRKDTGMDTGYYGCVVIYDSTEEAIRFLEMLRDKLYSTPFYIEKTTRITRFNVLRSVRDGINDRKYSKYRVDINELNSFIADLRNQTVEFQAELITVSTATDPIEPEPIAEQPKRVTWRWSV